MSPDLYICSLLSIITFAPPSIAGTIKPGPPGVSCCLTLPSDIRSFITLSADPVLSTTLVTMFSSFVNFLAVSKSLSTNFWNVGLTLPSASSVLIASIRASLSVLKAGSAPFISSVNVCFSTSKAISLPVISFGEFCITASIRLAYSN